jgi:hypothetical protein
LTDPLTDLGWNHEREKQSDYERYVPVKKRILMRTLSVTEIVKTTWMNRGSGYASFLCAFLCLYLFVLTKWIVS